MCVAGEISVPGRQSKVTVEEEEHYEDDGRYEVSCFEKFVILVPTARQLSEFDQSPLQVTEGAPLRTKSNVPGLVWRRLLSNKPRMFSIPSSYHPSRREPG